MNNCKHPSTSIKSITPAEVICDSCSKEYSISEKAIVLKSGLTAKQLYMFSHKLGNLKIAMERKENDVMKNLENFRLEIGLGFRERNGG